MRTVGLRRHSLAVLLFVSAACLVPVTSVQAAATWLPPQTITSPSSAVSSVAAGSDASGGVAAAWVRSTGSENVVEVATRPAGGGFTVQTLQSGTGSASNVVLAVNGKGDAIMAWRRFGVKSEIWVSTRAAGGSFGPPQAIASVPGKEALEPSVAINELGMVSVVWYLVNSDTNNLQTIYGAFRSPGGGFVSTPISSSDTWNQSPRVVLDETGKATVVWSYWDGSINIARVRIRDANGTFGVQRDLSASTPTGYPMFATVGLDKSGNAVAVWSHFDGSVYDVEGASRQAAADTWTPLPAFGASASASFGQEPVVAVDPSGNAVAIWQAANSTINSASRAPGGSFGTAQTGISAPTSIAPRVVLDPSGNAVAVWQRFDPNGRVEAAQRPAGGQFGGVKTLSTQINAGAPALSMDSLGNAFAVWSLADPAAPASADSVVQFAALDSSAPDLTSLSAPASAIAGVPSSFSVAATDVWSPVSVSWDFGDGQSAGGPSVSHVYTAPGARTVTVKATDAVGNERTATRTIEVSSPATAKLRRLRARLSSSFKPHGKFTTVKKLQLNVPSGSTVAAICKAGKKKCAGKAKKKFTKKKASGKVSLSPYVGRDFKAGTTITITVSKPGFIGEVTVLKMRRGKAPRLTTKCLPPGAKAPVAC